MARRLLTFPRLVREGGRNLFDKLRFRSLLLLVTSVVLWGPRDGHTAPLWSTAYYAGWMQGYLPPSAVDFTALTHVIHFSLVPKRDGSLNSNRNVITPAHSAELLSRAHAAGVPVLISVGGENSAEGFRGATNSRNLSRFISNLVRFMTTRGYDGVDVDWEPLDSSDARQYSALIDGLRSGLNAVSPRPLLTAAVANQPALVASLQSNLDQINLMTYSLAGPEPGWVTWFNSPLFDGGYRFPSSGGLVPSTDGMLKSFLSAGVAASKLGIGIDFYGELWSGGSGMPAGGATAPRESWSTPPTTYELPYYSIMDNYSQSPSRYFWDVAAESAYLSLDDSGEANDKFISYDDENACQSKVEYAGARGIGGVMIWELGGGYRANQPQGQRDLLLQTVKQALSATKPTAVATPVAPSPTPPPTATPTAVSSPIPTNAPDPTATPTGIPTATPSAVFSPTLAQTPMATSTPAGAILQDDFPTADRLAGDHLITSYNYYDSASFPAGGTSAPSNPSSKWEGDTGSFFAENGWGYSGRPIDWVDRYFFRFNTRSFGIQNAAISWKYRSANFGEDGYTVDGADAANVWLRYQTQYDLYVFQFDRTNNGVQVKRKVPAQGWTGPANLVASKGVYYTLPTDSEQPIFGAGSYLISWGGVKNLLPASERSKPGFPNLAHDSVTPYDFRVTVANVAGGKVQIKAWRAGALIYSATDDGRSGIAANGETQGSHLDKGYYNSVPGWQAAWGLPITHGGASGFRADNIQFWIDDFVVAAQ